MIKTDSPKAEDSGVREGQQRRAPTREPNPPSLQAPVLQEQHDVYLYVYIYEYLTMYVSNYVCI